MGHCSSTTTTSEQDVKSEHEIKSQSKNESKLRQASALPVVATINVGVTPAAIAITSNNFAYVANCNDYNIEGQDTVSVLNLMNNTVATTISDKSFSQPFTITLNENENKAYVTNSNSTTVSVIDTTKNIVTHVIQGFDGPSGFAIIPNKNKAYVNNYGEGKTNGKGNTVSVVEDDLVKSKIVVPQAPSALTITPDGEFLYVCCYVDGTQNSGCVCVIQTSNDSIIKVINNFFGPFAIVIAPDSTYAYVTNFGSNNFAPFGTSVSIIDMKQNQIVGSIDQLGIQPSGIAIIPDSKYLCVSIYNTLYKVPESKIPELTYGQGTVLIIDMSSTSNQVISSTPVGNGPCSVAIRSNFAYVTNYGSNTVNVIKLIH